MTGGHSRVVSFNIASRRTLRSSVPFWPTHSARHSNRGPFCVKTKRFNSSAVTRLARPSTARLLVPMRMWLIRSSIPGVPFTSAEHHLRFLASNLLRIKSWRPFRESMSRFRGECQNPRLTLVGIKENWPRRRSSCNSTMRSKSGSASSRSRKERRKSFHESFFIVLYRSICASLGTRSKNSDESLRMLLSISEDCSECIHRCHEVFIRIWRSPSSSSKFGGVKKSCINCQYAGPAIDRGTTLSETGPCSLSRTSLT